MVYLKLNFHHFSILLLKSFNNEPHFQYKFQTSWAIFYISYSKQIPFHYLTLELKNSAAFYFSGVEFTLNSCLSLIVKALSKVIHAFLTLVQFLLHHLVIVIYPLKRAKHHLF